MKHTPVVHTNCETLGCSICDGGLYCCKICGLIEGSLTTDCPGEEAWAEKNEDIYAGEIDFRDGQWVEETSPHSPQIHLTKS